MKVTFFCENDSKRYILICRIITTPTMKTQEDFFINICTSHFIVRVRKGLLRVCLWEGVGDRTQTVIFWHMLLWPATLCLSRSPDAQLEAQGLTLLGDGFLYCILSTTSLGPNLIGGPEPLRLVWLSLPQLVNNSVRSLTATVLTSVLTELYNSSTSTQSPTRSLKWFGLVWFLCLMAYQSLLGI